MGLGVSCPIALGVDTDSLDSTGNSRLDGYPRLRNAEVLGKQIDQTFVGSAIHGSLQ